MFSYIHSLYLAREAHDVDRLRPLIDEVSSKNKSVARLAVVDLVQELAELVVAAVNVPHNNGASSFCSGGHQDGFGFRV